MKKYINVLKRTKLFAGVLEEEIEPMLNCLGAKLKTYKKGEYVLREGEYVESLALLVFGQLHIQKDDFWGNRSIINLIEVGEMFGEAYIPKNSGALLHDVVATEYSAVMFFDIHRMLSVCSSACRFHTQTIQNLFFAISEKNRKLLGKIVVTSKRTTREKLLSYLSDEAKKNGSSSFEIPFNRQQLADYLSVDRSAMSNELSKMRDAGILTFERNRFCLK